MSNFKKCFLLLILVGGFAYTGIVRPGEEDGLSQDTSKVTHRLLVAESGQAGLAQIDGITVPDSMTASRQSDGQEGKLVKIIKARPCCTCCCGCCCLCCCGCFYLCHRLAENFPEIMVRLILAHDPHYNL